MTSDRASPGFQLWEGHLSLSVCPSQCMLGRERVESLDESIIYPDRVIVLVFIAEISQKRKLS